MPPSQRSDAAEKLGISMGRVIIIPWVMIGDDAVIGAGAQHELLQTERLWWAIRRTLSHAKDSGGPL
jgi:hypothetical protein